MPERQIIPIALTPPNIDGLPENNIIDCQNVEFLPGGGVVSRRGSVLHQELSVVSNPPGRVALVINPNVPNLTDGTVLAMAIDTEGGTSETLAMEPFKPRNQMPEDIAPSIIEFSRATGGPDSPLMTPGDSATVQFAAEYGATLRLRVTRRNGLARAVSVGWVLQSGTALPGVDYTAASGTLNFAAYERDAFITVTTLEVNQTVNRYFYARLNDPTPGALLGTFATASILLSTSYIPVFGGTAPLTGATAEDMQIPVYFFNNLTSPPEVHGHYLNAPFFADDDTGLPVPSESQFSRRLTSDIIALVDVPTDADQYTTPRSSVIAITLFSIAALRAQGGAYSDGATSKATALKASPVSRIVIAKLIQETFDPVTVARRVDILPYSSRHAFVVTKNRIVRIDLTRGIRDKQVTVENLPGLTVQGDPTFEPTRAQSLTVVDSSGYIIQQRHADGANWLVRYNPQNGRIINAKRAALTATTTPVYQVMAAVARSGSVFGGIVSYNGTSLLYTSFDLSSTVTVINMTTANIRVLTGSQIALSRQNRMVWFSSDTGTLLTTAITFPSTIGTVYDHTAMATPSGSNLCWCGWYDDDRIIAVKWGSPGTVYIAPWNDPGAGVTTSLVDADDDTLFRAGLEQGCSEDAALTVARTVSGALI